MKARIIFGTMHLGMFFPPQHCQLEAQHRLCFRCFHASLPAALALSKVQISAASRAQLPQWPDSQPPSTDLKKKKFFFSTPECFYFSLSHIFLFLSIPTATVLPRNVFAPCLDFLPAINPLLLIFYPSFQSIFKPAAWVLFQVPG